MRVRGAKARNRVIVRSAACLCETVCFSVHWEFLGGCLNAWTQSLDVWSHRMAWKMQRLGLENCGSRVVWSHYFRLGPSHVARWSDEAKSNARERHREGRVEIQIGGRNVPASCGGFVSCQFGRGTPESWRWNEDELIKRLIKTRHLNDENTVQYMSKSRSLSLGKYHAMTVIRMTDWADVILDPVWWFFVTKRLEISILCSSDCVHEYEDFRGGATVTLLASGAWRWAQPQSLSL